MPVFYLENLYEAFPELSQIFGECNGVVIVLDSGEVFG